MGRNESNQTNKTTINEPWHEISNNLVCATSKASLQCYSVLSDILVKIGLCIPLERGSNVLPTGKGFICLSPPSKLKVAVLFCSILVQCYSVLSDFHPMANDDYVT